MTGVQTCALPIYAHVMVARRERKDLVQVLALDPELVFAGRVAGVLADFEHGDDHHFHFDRPRGGRGSGSLRRRRSRAGSYRHKQDAQSGDKSAQGDSSFDSESDGATAKRFYISLRNGKLSLWRAAVE